MNLLSGGNMDLATTKQFRFAVKSVLRSRLTSQQTYTDKMRASWHNDDDQRRYVKIYGMCLTKQDVDAVEFILWVSGVTAKTRIGQDGRSLRGTCLVDKR